MNEINIILNSEIGEERDKSLLKNDKTILFEKINNDLHIIDFNKKTSNFIGNKIDLISYKLLDFIENDNFLDFLNELDLSIGDINNISFEDAILEKINDKGKETLFSKKIIIKKLLEFINPIINKNDLITSVKNISTNSTKSQNSFINDKNIIIDKNKITLNYPIQAKYISNISRNASSTTKDKNKKDILKSYIIPHLNHFNILGLYNTHLNLNIPFKFNQFRIELLNLLNNSNILYPEKEKIVINDINYKNKSTFTIDSVKLINLIILYKLVLSKFESYNSNRELYLDDKVQIINEYNLNKDIDIKNKLSKLFIDQEYYKTYIIQFNSFLTYQIGNSFLNNIYNSFDNDSLLNLYENLIIYSIDNEKIKNKIEYLKNFKMNEIEYKKKILELDNAILINNKLEHITRNKFPNLFNNNIKEGIFNQHNKFDINKLQKKTKDIILLEFKKSENYIKNYLYNKCIHKKILKEFHKSLNKYNSFFELIKFIKKDTYSKSNTLHQCNICSFNLICPHIVEFYTLTFSKKRNADMDINNRNDDFVHQKILNKYMTKAPIDMIYYCKICGEELGKSADIEQNIEFKDNVRINTMEYSDSTSELISSTTTYIVYSYISFSNIGIKINKRQIINYIIDIITLYINNIEKKLRRGKNYDDIKINNILHFNIIIFIYATIIFMMNKYNNLIFNQPSKGKFNKFIIKKSNSIDPINKEIPIKGGRSMNILKERFQQAYDIIINYNYLLLNKLDYKVGNNSEVVKEILIKAYNLINDSKDIEIDSKVSNNLELIMNSPVYKYYFNIKNIYPIININKSNKRKHLGTNLSFQYEFISHGKKTKYNDYKNIIGDVDINKKPDYLFDKFIKPKFNVSDNKIINLEDIKEITSYSEYKYYSFLLFCYYINNKIYELPIYEFLEFNTIKNTKINDNIYLDVIKSNISENYKTYIPIIDIYFQKTVLIKKFELKLINNDIIYNLYPYSTIKLNNSRYFYEVQESKLNLNIYICEHDGKLHKFNLYIYLTDDKKEIVINKKELSSDKNLKILQYSKFNDYECIKCHKRKNKLINDKNYDNSIIKELISNKNDITNFYNIYRYKCPLKEYHQFNKKYECEYCKLSFKNILDEDVDIFKKFKKYYIQYLISINENQNKKISENLKLIIKMFNTDILKTYKKETITDSNKNSDIFINSINEMNLDELIIQLSKISKIDIKYFKILGLTEGYNYNEIDSIKIEYNNIDNRFIKISNYIRVLSIYYNLLININKVSKYYDYDFMEIINKIKLTGKVKSIISNLPVNECNLNNLFNFIKITNDDNKYIIEFGLKMVFNFIIKINDINNNKLNGILTDYIEFITNKIFKSDELYTNYNYAQLKQMFSESSTSMNDYDNYDYNDGNDDDDDDDNLFSFNDVEFGDDD
jgi:hypothetical protein